MFSVFVLISQERGSLASLREGKSTIYYIFISLHFLNIKKAYLYLSVCTHDSSQKRGDVRKNVMAKAVQNSI